MTVTVRRLARRLRDELRLPSAARRERARDAAGLVGDDPGADAVIDAGIAWLGLAQDRSASMDGGVARDFSLIHGWATSYPETTGYIIPTLVDYAAESGQPIWSDRARRMLAWLVSIQMEGGGFQGGRIDADVVVPVTFNTGQILLGLAAGQRAFGGYEEPLRLAGDWLVSSQDDDGCWRRHPTPFAAPGEKTYETHVSWGLFEAHRVAPDRGYQEAGAKQVRWALTNQRENGWLDDCCLTDPSRPLTHTLGYALRGIVEAFHATEDEEFLGAAERTADGLLGALHDDGFIAGRLGPDWSDAATWACLTGTAQVAHSWLLLFQSTRKEKYLDAARRANRYVRRTIRLDGPEETRGAVKGSFPVDGGYGTFEYLNWAVKFVVDSNMCERALEEPTR